MTQKIVLVTGATDGIGRHTALELCRRGAAVIVHGRTPAKVRAAVEGLGAAAPGATLHEAHGDLSRLDEVRALAAGLVERFPRLDAMVHNAGVFPETRSLTADGFELGFAVNHLAPFVLTHLALAPLRAARGRLVVVSSVAHQRGRLDLGDLTYAHGFTGYGGYARAKLCNVLFAAAMARRLARDGVTANSLHPGVVSTKLLASGFKMEGHDSHAEGAATSVFLALDPDAAGHTGQYFVKCRPATPSAMARDEALAEGLYAASAALTGIAPLPL